MPNYNKEKLKELVDERRLKEAGFPITHTGGYECYVKGCFFKDDEGVVEHCPTLSELIEACGDRFEEISKMTHKNHPKQKWGAHAYPCEVCGYEGLISGYGSTPIEAVANLYLALHEK